MRPIKFNISRNLIGLMNSNSMVQVKKGFVPIHNSYYKGGWGGHSYDQKKPRNSIYRAYISVIYGCATVS